MQLLCFGQRERKVCGSRTAAPMQNVFHQKMPREFIAARRHRDRWSISCVPFGRLVYARDDVRRWCNVTFRFAVACTRGTHLLLALYPLFPIPLQRNYYDYYIIFFFVLPARHAFLRWIPLCWRSCAAVVWNLHGACLHCSGTRCHTMQCRLLLRLTSICISVERKNIGHSRCKKSSPILEYFLRGNGNNVREKKQQQK